jgi:hypothetical protein
MADPEMGWKILVGLLEPDGLLKIGLYSARARRGVDAAHALRDERGWTATPEEIRLARREIARLPEDHPARTLLRSPDFYSISGCRDLAFHVCEHRFDLPSLAAAMDRLGLEFLGFQHFRPEVARWYTERWPDDTAQTDLARWDELERDRPDIFAGMYQFWCRKKAEERR